MHCAREKNLILFRAKISHAIQDSAFPMPRALLYLWSYPNQNRTIMPRAIQLILSCFLCEQQPTLHFIHHGCELRTILHSSPICKKYVPQPLLLFSILLFHPKPQVLWLQRLFCFHYALFSVFMNKAFSVLFYFERYASLSGNIKSCKLKRKICFWRDSLKQIIKH